MASRGSEDNQRTVLRVCECTVKIHLLSFSLSFFTYTAKGAAQGQKKYKDE